MTDTRKIAEDIMTYSKAHENDALEGKPGFVGWETPYYCQTIDEIEEEVIEYGYTSTSHAIREMTKGFKMYESYANDIRNS